MIYTLLFYNAITLAYHLHKYDLLSSATYVEHKGKIRGPRRKLQVLFSGITKRKKENKYGYFHFGKWI